MSGTEGGRAIARSVQVPARLIELFPREPDHYFALAAAYGRLGKPEDVVEVYRRLTAARPDLSVAHFNLACWLRRLGRLEDSSRDRVAFGRQLSCQRGTPSVRSARLCPRALHNTAMVPVPGPGQGAFRGQNGLRLRQPRRARSIAKT